MLRYFKEVFSTLHPHQRKWVWSACILGVVLKLRFSLCWRRGAKKKKRFELWWQSQNDTFSSLHLLLARSGMNARFMSSSASRSEQQRMFWMTAPTSTCCLFPQSDVTARTEALRPHACCFPLSHKCTTFYVAITPELHTIRILTMLQGSLCWNFAVKHGCHGNGACHPEKPLQLCDAVPRIKRIFI